MDILANAKALYELGQYEELIDICKDEDKSGVLGLLYSKANLALGNIKIAKAKIDESIRNNNHVEESKYLLAIIECKTGDFDNAIKSLASIKTEGQLKADVQLLMSEIHIKRKEYQTARRILARLLQVAGTTHNCFHQLGRIEEIDKNYDISIEYYEKSCTIFKKAESYFALGRIYFSIGEIGLANLNFSKSSDIHETNRIRVLNSNKALKIRPFKLKHDLEQSKYILNKSTDNKSKISDYRDNLEKLLKREKVNSMPPWSWLSCSEYERHLLNGFLGRTLYKAREYTKVTRIINPKLLKTETPPPFKNSVKIYDDFIIPSAIDELYENLILSTIWHDYKYENGYLGAYLDKGLSSILLLTIAREISDFLSKDLGENTIEHIWAFKYDSKVNGIGLHADFSMLTLNLWLTPSHFNCAPDSGGLILYNQKAPLESSFYEYNAAINGVREREIRSHESLTVTYKKNRAILFDSSLYHETDSVRFTEKYEASRINVSFLFGNRSY